MRQGARSPRIRRIHMCVGPGQAWRSDIDFNTSQPLFAVKTRSRSGRALEEMAVFAAAPAHQVPTNYCKLMLDT